MTRISHIAHAYFAGLTVYIALGIALELFAHFN